MMIGHQHTLALLDRLAPLAGERGFLFTGPEACGKFLAARQWAFRLAGAAELSEETAGHPNLRVVAPVEETGDRGVIREKDIPLRDILSLRRFLAFSPLSGTRRVAVVRDAHRLTEKAMNALLKTLEEPPEGSTIILVTHLPGALPETILSRLHNVPFSPVPEAEMARHFPGTTVPELLPLGSPGLLIRAARDPEAFAAEREALLSLLHLPGRLTVRLALAERLAKNLPLAERVFLWWGAALERAARQGTGDATRAALLSADAAVRAARALAREPGSGRLIIERALLRA